MVTCSPAPRRQTLTTIPERGNRVLFILPNGKDLMVHIIRCNTSGPHTTLRVEFAPGSLEDAQVMSTRTVISDHFGVGVPVSFDGFSLEGDGDRQIVLDISDPALVGHLNEVVGLFADTVSATLDEEYLALNRAT